MLASLTWLTIACGRGIGLCSRVSASGMYGPSATEKESRLTVHSVSLSAHRDGRLVTVEHSLVLRASLRAQARGSHRGDGQRGFCPIFTRQLSVVDRNKCVFAEADTFASIRKQGDH